MMINYKILHKWVYVTFLCKWICKNLQFVVIAIIGSIPLLVYCCQFGGTDSHLSDDPEDWAFFGDYIGGVYSVILTCLLTYLTYFLQKRGVVSKSRREVILNLFVKYTTLVSAKNLRIEQVNNFTQLIVNSEIIFYNEKEYRDMLDISDYFVVVMGGGTRDYSLENEYRIRLIKMYNENG